MVWWMGGISGGNGFDTNSILFHLEMCSILSDSWCDYSIVRIFFSFLLWNRIVLHSIWAREKAEQKQQHWGVEKKIQLNQQPLSLINNIQAKT